MRLYRQDITVTKEQDEDFPFISIKQIKATMPTQRKRARKLLADLGTKKFRFKDEPFEKFVYLNGEIERCTCFYFDFVNKAHRKTLKDL
jgi:hypothetical protein